MVSMHIHHLKCNIHAVPNLYASDGEFREVEGIYYTKPFFLPASYVAVYYTVNLRKCRYHYSKKHTECDGWTSAAHHKFQIVMHQVTCV